MSIWGSCSDKVEWTNGFLLGVVECLGIGLNDLAMNLVGPAAVVSEASGAHTDIDLGHAERFAIVQGLNRGEEFEILFEQIGELHEISSSLLWGDFAPRCFEGLACDGDGVVNIFFCGFMYFADGFLGGRVDGLEGLAILAFDELIVDEAAIIEISGQSLRSGTFGGGGAKIG